MAPGRGWKSSRRQISPIPMEQGQAFAKDQDFAKAGAAGRVAGLQLAGGEPAPATAFPNGGPAVCKIKSGKQQGHCKSRASSLQRPWHNPCRRGSGLIGKADHIFVSYPQTFSRGSLV